MAEKVVNRNLLEPKKLTNTIENKVFKMPTINYFKSKNDTLIVYLN